MYLFSIFVRFWKKIMVMSRTYSLVTRGHKNIKKIKIFLLMKSFWFWRLFKTEFLFRENWNPRTTTNWSSCQTEESYTTTTTTSLVSVGLTIWPRNKLDTWRCGRMQCVNGCRIPTCKSCMFPVELTLPISSRRKCGMGLIFGACKILSCIHCPTFFSSLFSTFISRASRPSPTSGRISCPPPEVGQQTSYHWYHWGNHCNPSDTPSGVAKDCQKS